MMQFQLVFEAVVFALISVAICAALLWLFMLAVAALVYLTGWVMAKLSGREY